MRILHICPLWFPVAQDAPGGIETLLAGLVGVLATLGCRNTLLASGDSITTADLIPVVPRNLCAEMEAETAWEYSYYEQHQLHLAAGLLAEVDVVHSHIGAPGYALSMAPRWREHVLHTQHNPVMPDLEWFVRQHPTLWYSTVSEFQARKMRRQGAVHCHVVHNGIDIETFRFQTKGSETLFYIGRMEREKGPDLAIAVAQTLGLPLMLAGPIVDEGYFQNAIRPHLNRQVEYLGVVNHRQKNELYGSAGCVLMPSRCDEGFGMVSVEAMACGTPVVALANGALPEIIEAGITGYVTPEESGLAALAKSALNLDRSLIRAAATARFSLSVVAENYLHLYTRMCAGA